MHDSVLATVQRAMDHGLDNIVIAIPEQIDASLADKLCRHPRVSGLVLTYPPPEITAQSTSQWLGYFPSPSTWILPKAKGPLVFLGPVQFLTRGMILRLLRSRRLQVYVVVDASLKSCNVIALLVERATRKYVLIVRGLSPHNPIRLAAKYIAHHLLSPALLRRLSLPLKDAEASQAVPKNYSGVFERIVLAAEHRNRERPNRYIARRVCHINAGLAAGGAERQLMNTLHGLVESKRCESVIFIAEYMKRGETIDFFSDMLRQDAVAIRPMRSLKPLEETLTHYPIALATALSELPSPLLSEIMALTDDLEELKPEVVHAWQDSTSIKAGVAAHIAGVPKIVLSGRNVSPRHFPYLTGYMADAYRCLVKSSRVKMINNSTAGAHDYSTWLGIPLGTISVLRNGVDLSALTAPGALSVAAYRASHGIPEGAIVVGSIYRFWPEKRPLLWLEVAKAVTLLLSQPVYFLVIGDGPMREEMTIRAKALGIADRVRLPGTTKAIGLPLATMSCFLLTSKFEGTPNVLLEAQWLGLPVVTTDAGGTREAVSEGKTGEVIATETVSELAAAVVRQLNLPLARQSAREYGPQFVREYFGLQRMVQETIELYDFS